MFTFQKEIDELFGYLNDITNDYEVRHIHTSPSRPSFSDRYEVIEKPDWKRKWQKDMLGQEIANVERKISHYQSQIEQLLSVQSEWKSKKEELKNKLNDLDNSEE